MNKGKPKVPDLSFLSFARRDRRGLQRILIAGLLVGWLPARAQPARLEAPEVSLAAAFLDEQTSVHGLTPNEPSLGEAVTARGVFPWGGFGEAQLLFTQALTPDTTAPGLSAVTRVGYSGERWALQAGPSFQYTPGAKPALQILPSLRADVMLGPAQLILGVLDAYAVALAQVSVGYHGYELGYVAPFGGRAAGEWRIAKQLLLRAQVMGFTGFGATTFFGTLGVAWRPR